MRDNGERIYAGLMDREEMLTLEEENHPQKEKDFLRERNKYKLADLVNNLLAKDDEE